MKTFLDIPFLSPMPFLEFGTPQGTNLGFTLRWTTMRELMMVGNFMMGMMKKP